MEAFLKAAEASPADEGVLRDFVVCSSVDHPFLVVSDGQLVTGVRTPEQAELDLVSMLAAKYVEASDAAGTAMIADFEGEMPGHGGELVTAAFLATALVDSGRLAQPPEAAARPDMLGLLIDLRSRPGAALLEQIMRSRGIVKLIWGADADLQSLMYQDVPVPLRAEPASVVDVQLAFSGPNRRLGMQRMLESVPPRLLAGLPNKAQIDFDAFHSRNRRAMPVPLSRRDAAYAMDDLHRIDAILHSMAPSGGSYAGARRATEQILEATRADPFGLNSLVSELQWFEKKWGVKKLAKAVGIKRQILAIRAKLAGSAEPSWVSSAEQRVDAELSRARVRIPADLSFSS